MLTGGAFYFYSHKGSLFLCIKGQRKRRGGRVRGELCFMLSFSYTTTTQIYMQAAFPPQHAPDTLFAVAETTPSTPVFSSHHWDRDLTASF